MCPLTGLLGSQHRLCSEGCLEKSGAEIWRFTATWRRVCWDSGRKQDTGILSRLSPTCGGFLGGPSGFLRPAFGLYCSAVVFPCTPGSDRMSYTTSLWVRVTSPGAQEEQSGLAKVTPLAGDRMKTWPRSLDCPSRSIRIRGRCSQPKVKPLVCY